MKLPKRAQRWLACTAAIGALGLTTAALVAMPAQAAWPATIKICNALETSDTNGGSTDGKNIDIDRPAGGGFDLYSNELAPGDCTGNVGNPSAVRIDLTDDGVNFVPDGSSMIGIDADGIDDSQGPWDMPCVDSVTASNENALPIQQTTAEHVPAGGAIQVRIRAARNCGANLTDHVRVCNDGAGIGNFDVFKTDGSYNNELAKGECTNYKDVDGNNPLAIDVYDDAARAVTEWKWKDDSVGTWSPCERDKAAEDDADTVLEVGSILDFNANDQTYIGTRTVRLYADGTSAGTMCGVTGTIPTDEVTQEPSGLPTDADPDEVGDENLPTPAWVPSSTPEAPLMEQ